ncbi:MAG: hypothetical protein WBC60_04105 [Cognaticolwellia sp.]
MHLSLIHNIPDDLRKHIDDHYERIIQFYPAKRLTMWPRLRVLIENHECQLITQSSLQYLTHHHCIISRCLLGYSLSQANLSYGPVISNDLAEHYLDTGIGLVKEFKNEIDLSWLLESRFELWKEVCRVFLCHAYRTDNSTDNSIIFAEKFVDFTSQKIAI